MCRLQGLHLGRSTHHLPPGVAAVVVEVRIVRVQPGSCREVVDGTLKVVDAVTGDAPIVECIAALGVRCYGCCVIRQCRRVVAYL